VTMEISNSGSDLKLWDKEHLLVQIGGNESILMQLVDMFLVDVPNQIESLKNELDSNNLEGAIGLAHGIKGSALNLGAFQFAEVGSLMEEAAKENNTDFLYTNLPKLRESYDTVAAVFRAYKQSEGS